MVISYFKGNHIRKEKDMKDKYFELFKFEDM